MVVAARLVGIRRRVWIGRRVGSGIRCRVRLRVWCRRGRIAAVGCGRRPHPAGAAAADVVEFRALLDAEEHVDECRQLRRGLQHGEGVQHVVGLADGLVGGLAGIGQFALALSGEVRLHLGIASKLDSALGLH